MILIITIHINLSDNQSHSDFCSTKFDYVSLREEPDYDSYVKLVYVNKNEPLKVIGACCNWKKVQDIDNYVGWIHVSVLSNKRYIIIKSNENKALYKDFDSLKIKGFIEPNVRCRLLMHNSSWCKIFVQGHHGWISKSDIWGLE